MSHFEEIEEIEVTIEDVNTEQSSESIEELQKMFNAYKNEDAKESSVLNTATLNSMEEVNKLVADALLQFENLVTVDNTGIISKTKNKMLAVIDPKNTWLSKWTKNVKENVKRADIGASTGDEIVKNLRKNIEKKRDEVVEIIHKVIVERERIISRVKFYEEIAEKAEKIYQNTDKNSKENFDAQMLATMSNGTVINLKSTVENNIDFYLASARMSVTKIEMSLPGIEEKFQSKLGLKGAQQQLSDLNSMTQVTIDLSNALEEVVTSSIYETTLQTVKLLKDTGVNVQSLEKRIQRDNKFKEELNRELNDVKNTINKEYNEINKLKNIELPFNKTDNQIFIDSYVKSNQRWL